MASAAENIRLRYLTPDSKIFLNDRLDTQRHRPHAASLQPIIYSKKPFKSYQTYLASLQDVQKYSKNTNKKHGTRHICGRGEALGSRLVLTLVQHARNLRTSWSV